MFIYVEDPSGSFYYIHMRDLRTYINEGIFDIEDNIQNIDKQIKKEIRKFIHENFRGVSSCKISSKPNKDGKYEVSSTGTIEIANRDIKALTNGLFVWKKVDGSFTCNSCEKLKSLEGAPRIVGKDFVCQFDTSLTSFEGAPNEIGRTFNAMFCSSLISLKGSPSIVGNSYACSHSGKKFTESDIRKVCNVAGQIYV